MCGAWALKGNFNPSSEFYGKEIYTAEIYRMEVRPPDPPVRTSSQSTFQEVIKDDL